jgi:hypothetical protein
MGNKIEEKSFRDVFGFDPKGRNSRIGRGILENAIVNNVFRDLIRKHNSIAAKQLDLVRKNPEEIKIDDLEEYDKPCGEILTLNCQIAEALVLATKEGYYIEKSIKYLLPVKIETAK